MKSALEVREAMKSADALLQDIRWELVNNINSFSADDIDQIVKIAKFIKIKTFEIVATANDSLIRR